MSVLKHIHPPKISYKEDFAIAYYGKYNEYIIADNEEDRIFYKKIMDRLIQAYRPYLSMETMDETAKQIA
jgi:hypothetical protein